MARIVVGISGASGIILAHRMIDALTSIGHFVELIMTQDASYTAFEEMGEAFAGPVKFTQSFSEEQQKVIRHHHNNDFGSPLASGTFQFDAMVIVPCSMASLAAITIGLSDNLLRRVADVAIKERRKLILVPRESPLSEIHLENMLKLAKAGVVIMPPQPAWYTKPKTVEDVELHIIGRVFDAMRVTPNNYARWEGVRKSHV